MPTVHHWWDAQTKQTRQTYRQSIQTTRRQFTKRWKRIIRPRKHATKELRNIRVRMVHVTAVLHVRNEDELADTYTYMLR